MDIRFVTAKRCDQSGAMTGVFQAAFSLQERDVLEAWEEEWLERELAWLKMHLKSPACLSEPENRRAICWFHPRARRAIDKVRSIAALLAEHGELVTMKKTTDPGIVIYEDGWQVAAKPRHKRQRRRLPEGEEGAREEQGREGK